MNVMAKLAMLLKNVGVVVLWSERTNADQQNKKKGCESRTPVSSRRAGKAAFLSRCAPLAQRN
jgi:hypothetical protein